MESKAEQKEFVLSLCQNIANEIMRDIEFDRVPADWDGFELRHLVVVKAQRAAYLKMSVSRNRKFHNTILINNL